MFGLSFWFGYCYDWVIYPKAELAQQRFPKTHCKFCIIMEPAFHWSCGESTIDSWKGTSSAFAHPLTFPPSGFCEISLEILGPPYKLIGRVGAKMHRPDNVWIKLLRCIECSISSNIVLPKVEKAKTVEVMKPKNFESCGLWLKNFHHVSTVFHLVFHNGVS